MYVPPTTDVRSARSARWSTLPSGDELYVYDSHAVQSGAILPHCSVSYACISRSLQATLVIIIYICIINVDKAINECKVGIEKSAMVTMRHWECANSVHSECKVGIGGGECYAGVGLSVSKTTL